MSSGFDPEAEQEVDFGRYRRLFAARWWVPAAGLVVGAVVGYLVALGGSQVFKATATLYLGQPYSASGTQQLQAAQTNPSTVKKIAHAESVVARVASECKTKPSLFRGGISTQSVAGNIVKNGQTPLVTDQQQKLTLLQLLQQASIVEKPSVPTGAHATRVTARSRRNSVVVA